MTEISQGIEKDDSERDKERIFLNELTIDEPKHEKEEVKDNTNSNPFAFMDNNTSNEENKKESNDSDDETIDIQF